MTLTPEPRPDDRSRRNRLLLAATLGLILIGAALALFAYVSLTNQMEAVARRGAQVEAKQAELTRGLAAFESERGQLLAQTKAAQVEAEEARERAAAAEKQLRDSAKHYQESIDLIISHARGPLSLPPSPDSDPQIISSCRSLVAARNAFREALREVERNLDGDFDRLEAQMHDRIDPVQLRQSLLELNESWPAKRQALDDVIPRMLRQLAL